MRLGEVFDHTRSEPDAAPAPRRRLDWLLALLALCALAGFLYRHGPGITHVGPDELIVVRPLVTAPFLDPEPRVVQEEGLTAWVPLLQSIERLEAGPHEVAAAADARTRDGAAVRLETAYLHYRIRPADALTVLERLGPDPASHEAAAEALLRAALLDVLATTDLATLLDQRAGDRGLFAPLRGRLAGQLAELGLELTHLRTAGWRLDPALGAVHGDIEGVRGRIRGHEREIEQIRLASAARVAEIRAEEARALDEARGTIATELADADRAAAETRREADRYAVQRTTAAGGERAALLALAAAREAAARAEADALAARVRAAAQGGIALLDLTIAREIIPQLARLRTTPQRPRPTEDGE